MSAMLTDLTEMSCANADPELFYPDGPVAERRLATKAAKAICAECPVREKCLRVALATDEAHGVWGGLTADERRRMAGKTKTTWRPR